MKLYTTVSISLLTEQAQELDRIADERHKNRSELLQEIITIWLNKEFQESQQKRAFS